MKNIFLIALAMVVGLASCQQTPKEATECTKPCEQKNAVVENIMNRRSIRAYKPEQISKGQLDTIIQCAINAPSAKNEQSWEIRVVQNPELLAAISTGYKAYNAEQEKAAGKSGSIEREVFYQAPTLIVVANKVDFKYSQVDCGLLGQNILLAAESMNIGTCVVGMVIEYLNSDKAKDIVAKLQLPEGYKPLYTIALGYKNETPEAKPRNAEKVKIIE